MANKVDTRLLMAAAQVARQWQKSEVGKEWIRNDFAKFAKPYWLKQGGEELVDHMMGKYVNNDEQSFVECFYNLDHHNKEIVVEWLLSKVKGDSKERRDCISRGGLTMDLTYNIREMITSNGMKKYIKENLSRIVSITFISPIFIVTSLLKEEYKIAIIFLLAFFIDILFLFYFFFKQKKLRKEVDDRHTADCARYHDLSNLNRY